MYLMSQDYLVQEQTTCARPTGVRILMFIDQAKYQEQQCMHNSLQTFENIIIEILLKKEAWMG